MDITHQNPIPSPGHCSPISPFSDHRSARAQRSVWSEIAAAGAPREIQLMNGFREEPAFPSDFRSRVVHCYVDVVTVGGLTELAALARSRPEILEWRVLCGGASDCASGRVTAGRGRISRAQWETPSPTVASLLAQAGVDLVEAARLAAEEAAERKEVAAAVYVGSVEWARRAMGRAS